MQESEAAPAHPDAGATSILLKGDEKASIIQRRDRRLRGVACEVSPECPREKIARGRQLHVEGAIHERVVDAQVAAVGVVDDLERVQAVSEVVPGRVPVRGCGWNVLHYGLQLRLVSRCVDWQAERNQDRSEEHTSEL